MSRLFDADALVDALMTYTWRDEDERLIDDADEKRAYIEQWLPNLPTVGGWVSVKDRMPKDGQDVLAYLNNGEETRIAPCNYYNRVWFDSVMNCVVVLQDVTHWMPLPEPPEEEA